MHISGKAVRPAVATLLLTAALAAVPAAVVPAAAQSGNVAGNAAGTHGGGSGGADRTVRIATYNASLNGGSAGELLRDLQTPDNQQARNVAEVIQINSPDIVLINEFDYYEDYQAVDLFRDNYLEVGQNGQAPVEYPYAYTAPSNTGTPSGLDLNNDGTVGGPDDAYGFGLFEGQYGMVVLSKYPIQADNVRTFQNFLWKDMPGAMLPDNPATEAPQDWFSAEELDQVRLSSKSHWDVPVDVNGKTIHVLASHPTPPSFDGAEDRNGKRNNDEIRLWADYVTGGKAASYIYDDAGTAGGLKPGERFVVMGDQNSDPLDGDSVEGSIQQLLEHHRIQDPAPTSAGAAEASVRQGGINSSHLSDPAYDTADFNDNPAPGNLRADYVLPSKNLNVLDSFVFWPEPGQAGAELTGEYPFPTSDHRPVVVDVRL